MNDYIRPYADVVVKYILGTEQNKDLLLSFINAVLADSHFPSIISIELLDKSNEREYYQDKFSVLDIKAKDENGKLYNIEIQILREADYTHRSLYYWAKTYSAQMNEGDAYLDLKPTICINLLCFELLKNLDKIHSCFLLTEKSMPEYILTEHEIIHFIELPKYERILQKQGKDIHPMLKKWIEFFIYEGKEDEKMKVLLTDNFINKAHEQYKKFTADEQMQIIYDARWKQMMDYNSLMASARKEGLEQGRAEGIEQGIEEGIEKGIEQGIEKGIEKGIFQGKLETAKNMLNAGLEVEKVAQFTDLPLEVFRKLSDE